MLKTITVLASLLLAIPAWAETPVEITLAHGMRQNPFAVPTAAMAWKFKDAVETRSQGAIHVTIVPDGQAGDESQVPRLVKNNVVQTAFMSAGALIPHYPPIIATMVPFVTASKAQAAAVYDGDFGRALAQDIQTQTGMVVLGFGIEDGVQIICNSRRPILAPEDVDGLRLAQIPGPGLNGIMGQALAAKLIPVSRMDSQSALDSGLVDGVIGSSEDMTRYRYDESMTFATVSNHRHAPVIWLFNSDVFGRLDDAQRRLVQQAASDALASGRVLAARLDQDLTSPRMLARLMDVVVLTAAQRAAFGDVTRPVMEQAVQAQYGDAARQWLDRFQAAAATAKP